MAGTQTPTIPVRMTPLYRVVLRGKLMPSLTPLGAHNVRTIRPYGNLG